MSVRRIREIQRKLNNILNPDKVLSKSEIDKIMREARTLTNDMVEAMTDILESKAGLDQYRKDYRETARILKKMGYTISLDPKDIGATDDILRRMQADFDSRMRTTKEIQEWFARNRLEISSQSAGTIRRTLNRNLEIDKMKIPEAEKTKLKQQNLAQIKQRYQPRFTILKLKEIDTPTEWINKMKSVRGIYGGSLWEKYDKRRIYLNFDQSYFSTNMRDAKVYLDLEDFQFKSNVDKRFFTRAGYFDQSDYQIYNGFMEDVEKTVRDDLKDYQKGLKRYESSVITTLQDKVTSRIESGMKRGETFRQTQLAIQRIVDEKFPTGKVSVFNVRDGVGKMWSQDSVNYTANWVRNQQTRFSSDACIDAMNQVNADIVEYFLGTAVTDHTEVCEELAAGSPYSLSGNSDTYPPLPQAPPASPPPHPCQSRIVPAPMEIQENYGMPETRLDTLKEVG